MKGSFSILSPLLLIPAVPRMIPAFSVRHKSKVIAETTYALNQGSLLAMEEKSLGIMDANNLMIKGDI
jgi:hypothetical protein